MNEPPPRRCARLEESVVEADAARLLRAAARPAAEAERRLPDPVGRAAPGAPARLCSWPAPWRCGRARRRASRPWRPGTSASAPTGSPDRSSRWSRARTSAARALRDPPGPDLRPAALRRERRLQRHDEGGGDREDHGAGAVGDRPQAAALEVGGASAAARRASSSRPCSSPPSAPWPRATR